jgi:hypothetical protein
LDVLQFGLCGPLSRSGISEISEIPIDSFPLSQPIAFMFTVVKDGIHDSIHFALQIRDFFHSDLDDRLFFVTFILR